MFERFTDKALQVIMLAQEESRRLGHNYVGTEQILLGLLGEGSGIAYKVLKSMGMSVKDTRLEIERLIGRGTGFVAVEIPFTPRAKRVLELSLTQSKDLGHSYIGTEHILLSLIEDKFGVAPIVLKTFNVDPSEVKVRVYQQMGEIMEMTSSTSPSSTATKEQSRLKKSVSDYFIIDGEEEELQTPTLEEYTTNLTELASQGRLDPVVGRKKEIERVIQILSRRRKNNPILIGEPGVGKTAVAEGLAQRIIAHEVPTTLYDKMVIVLDVGLLLAGTKYRGEFEERLKRIVEEIQASQNVIVVIDEVHTLVGAGAAEGALDAANILKPALARGELQCIGATTIEEYRQHIEKDPALERRFQPVHVNEPSVDETIEILSGLRRSYETHHNLYISDSALAAAAKMGEQYIADRFLPDKAIDLIDEASSRVRLMNHKIPESAIELDRELREIVKKKEVCVRAQEYETAGQLLRQEMEIRSQISAIVKSKKMPSKLKVTGETVDKIEAQNEAKKIKNITAVQFSNLCSKAGFPELIGRQFLSNILPQTLFDQLTEKSENYYEARLNLEFPDQIISQSEEDTLSFEEQFKECYEEKYSIPYISLYDEQIREEIDIEKLVSETEKTKLISIDSNYSERRLNFEKRVNEEGKSAIALEEIASLRREGEKIQKAFKETFKMFIDKQVEFEQISESNAGESGVQINEELIKAGEKNTNELVEERPVVGEQDIAHVVAAWTGIPVNKLTKSETEKLVNMESIMHQRVIGQEQAISAVARAVRRARVGLQNPNRPIASFLFSGPTGVGKTELTKALSSYYFDSEESMIRFDMSEFMERHTVAKLIGSPPGYVGYSEGGQLTEAVRRRPYTVILFDEVEKAHPDVFNLLLQILEDGRLTDSKGRVVSFKNAIIIMTSNLGSSVIERSNEDDELGFEITSNTEETKYSKLCALVQEELKQFFRPEFLNRIDEIIVFERLTKANVGEIAEIMINDLIKRLDGQGIVLSVTEAVKDRLIEEGFNPTYGARPLRRAVMRLLEDRIASEYLKQMPNGGVSVLVDISEEDDDISVSIVPVNATKEKNIEEKKLELENRDKEMTIA